MPIRGIIFDMDGVLCDSEPFICEAACRMFQEHGVQVVPEDFQPFVGMGEERFLGGVAEKYGVKFNLAVDKTRTYDIYQEIIRGRLQPMNGARSFLDACRGRGLRHRRGGRRPSHGRRSRYESRPAGARAARRPSRPALSPGGQPLAVSPASRSTTKDRRKRIQIYVFPWRRIEYLNM